MSGQPKDLLRFEDREAAIEAARRDGWTHYESKGGALPLEEWFASGPWPSRCPVYYSGEALMVEWVGGFERDGVRAFGSFPLKKEGDNGKAQPTL